MESSYPVVVPAAGASRRMGRPKPLLDFDGRTGIDLVVSACEEAGCGPVHVVVGAGADPIRAALASRAGVEFVFNPDHEKGQTVSVQCGLRSIRGSASGFLIFPADHPLVTSADIRKLIDAFEGQEPGEGAVPVHAGRRGHPILLGWGHREAILSLDGATPLHDYIRPRLANLAQVDVDNEWVASAMNTPQEYARALEAHRRRKAED